MRIVRVLAAMAVGCWIGAGAAIADIGPVQWPANGHYYHMVQTVGLSWDDARSMASQKTWEGLPGHLATITSADESQFVFEGLGGPHRYKSWIGGYQWPRDTEDPAANWYWITGEAWDYTTWAPNAPNDDLGGEFFLDLYWNSPTSNWNDAGFQWDIESYIVEYESAATPAEESSWGRVKGMFRGR